MIKILTIFLFCFTVAFSSSHMEEFKWPSGISFLQYLKSNNIPLSLYYNLDKMDQELITEIRAGEQGFSLKNDDGEILQLLFPVNDELQMHIYKNKLRQYELKFTPIVYEERKNSLNLTITTSPYIDIVKATGNVELANAFIGLYKNTIDFTKISKGSRIVIIYSEKIRRDKPFGYPQILSTMVEHDKKRDYLYYYDSKFYDEKGKKVDSFLLIMPISGRISSVFTPKRYHPILKRYRAHLGVDIVNVIGTPVKASGDGRVTFVGRKTGYGNVVEIKHSSTYMTLYAHLKGFAPGLRVGKVVKQGQLVAFVGKTGLATGPHLHFGVYRNNVAIDPLKIVKVEKKTMLSKEELEFKKLVKNSNKQIESTLNLDKNITKFNDFKDMDPV